MRVYFNANFFKEQIEEQFKDLCKIACKKRNKLSALAAGEYSTNTASAQIIMKTIKERPDILEALSIDPNDKERLHQILKEKMLSACKEGSTLNISHRF